MRRKIVNRVRTKTRKSKPRKPNINNDSVMDYKELVKELGKSKDLTSKQKNRRIKQALKTMTFEKRNKANIIRAIGSASAQNTAPVAAAVATTRSVSNANDLINAGTGSTQPKNNTTDIDIEQYGDMRE